MPQTPSCTPEHCRGDSSWLPTVLLPGFCLRDTQMAQNYQCMAYARWIVYGSTNSQCLSNTYYSPGKVPLLQQYCSQVRIPEAQIFPIVELTGQFQAAPVQGS